MLVPYPAGLFYFSVMDFLQAIIAHSNDKQTELSLERAKVCAGCEFKEKRFYASFLNSKIEEVNGFVCILCDCPIATKIFAKKKKNICTKWTK